MNKGAITKMQKGLSKLSHVVSHLSGEFSIWGLNLVKNEQPLHLNYSLEDLFYHLISFIRVSRD